MGPMPTGSTVRGTTGRVPTVVKAVRVGRPNARCTGAPAATVGGAERVVVQPGTQVAAPAEVSRNVAAEGGPEGGSAEAAPAEDSAGEGGAVERATDNRAGADIAGAAAADVDSRCVADATSAEVACVAVGAGSAGSDLLAPDTEPGADAAVGADPEPGADPVAGADPVGGADPVSVFMAWPRGAPGAMTRAATILVGRPAGITAPSGRGLIAGSIVRAATVGAVRSGKVLGRCPATASRRVNHVSGARGGPAALSGDVAGSGATSPERYVAPVIRSRWITGGTTPTGASDGPLGTSSVPAGTSAGPAGMSPASESLRTPASAAPGGASPGFS